ncbi:nucleotide exchange factor GrpE [Candidatus Woesearchaeota archaeon]|nr:nucleotide exchange factor GrpE [Candidatus Woesearchaeota archaeon]
MAKQDKTGDNKPEQESKPATQTPEAKEAQAAPMNQEEKLKLELKEMTDTLQRLQAEFDNYRKRCDRENASFVKQANETLVKSLLPILDNLELALSHHHQDAEFHKGVELIYAQLSETLEASGLKRIECKDQKFDPHLHEALLSVESGQEPNTVLEELQKGYLFNGKVLRHSKVKIAKKTGKNNVQAPPSTEGKPD